MSIDTSVVELEVVWHVGVPCSGSQAVDFLIVGLECSHEVVDTGMGGGELLGGDSGASFHCGHGPVGHRSCNFTEFVPAETNEGFG